MDVIELQSKAKEVRQEIIKMITNAGSGHTAGSLGITDVVTALYFSILRHDPKNPDWPERDRFILSNGHVCPAVYVAMSLVGYFPKEKLATFRQFGTDLQGHPERAKLPGMETTSGPLGSGLCQAAGYAIAARMDNQPFRVYCLTSDGEHDSGNHWEGVMLAGKYKLSNLTLFVDRNNIQIDGFTEDIMPLEPLAEKYRVFNWNVIEIDGHNIEAILGAVDKAKEYRDGPTVIIAKTIPGKGVSFIENDYHWHGKAPSATEAVRALEELK